MKNGGSFHSYVSLPEGIKHESDVKYQPIPTADFGGAIRLPMATAWLTGEASRAILDTRPVNMEHGETNQLGRW